MSAATRAAAARISRIADRYWPHGSYGEKLTDPVECADVQTSLADARAALCIYPFVTTIHRPGLPDVHLGFAFRHQAEMACWSLTEDLIGTAHVEGTTVTWSPTPDGVDPQPPVVADATAVASLIEQEADDTSPEHRFPDVFSRLKAQEGYETASRIWRDACRSLDDAEVDE